MPLRYDDTQTTLELSEDDLVCHLSDREFVSIVTRFARQGTWLVDIESSHYWVSRGACEIFGVAHTDGPANRLDFRDKLHPDDRDIMAEAVSMASERRCSFAVTYRVQNGDCYKFVRTVGRYRAVDGKAGEIVGVTFEMGNHVREIVFGP